MLREALAVYHKLLKDGELDAKRDGELYLEFRKEEVRQTLSQFEEELGFRLLDTGKTIYLVPNQDNEVLGYTPKEYRQNISLDARLADAYLQSYIFMMIFQMFYGGKNTNPIQREFIQTKDLMEVLDQKMRGYLEDEEHTRELEREKDINFGKIARLWESKQIGDWNLRKSKYGTLSRAYHQLEQESLIRIFEEGQQIRRTKRMDDLFLYHFLDEERIQDLHKILGQGEENAED